MLLKWLGQVGAAAHVDCAVAVSVPFELEKAAWRLERGFSRIYQARLLHSLKASVARKHRQELLPAELGDLSAVHSFRDFDDVVTAPLHGFRDASHYYQESSSRQYLKGIRVPTLILHALDDPFMTPDAVPTPAELSRCTTLELSRRGGHVGFVAVPLAQRLCDGCRRAHTVHDHRHRHAAVAAVGGERVRTGHTRQSVPGRADPGVYSRAHQSGGGLRGAEGWGKNPGKRIDLAVREQARSYGGTARTRGFRGPARSYTTSCVPSFAANRLLPATP